MKEYNTESYNLGIGGGAGLYLGHIDIIEISGLFPVTDLRPYYDANRKKYDGFAAGMYLVTKYSLKLTSVISFNLGLKLIYASINELKDVNNEPFKNESNGIIPLELTGLSGSFGFVYNF